MNEKPKVAFFDFAGCEGDQLQIINLEEKFLELLEIVEIVSFREIMKEHSDEYKIAFIEGSIQRPIDEDRLKDIRSNSEILIALGDCACNGCVNKLQKDWELSEVKDEVYPEVGESMIGNKYFNVFQTKAVDEVVNVDYYIRGCPVRGERVLYYIKKLIEKPFTTNRKINYNLKLRGIEVDGRSLLKYNPEKCILCQRCSNVCQDILDVNALGTVDKGWRTVISTPYNIGFDANGCIRCGQCVAVCPVGALYTDSSLEKIMENMCNEEFSIAIDSIALSSLVQRHYLLNEMEPKLAEKYVIAGLRKIGFNRVIQYDYYISKSIELDKESEKPVLASWCLPARNHFKANNLDGLDLIEDNSPWTLLLSEEKDNTCLLSPCMGLKGVNDFQYVLSSQDLEALFKNTGLDIGFSDPDKGYYDGETVGDGFKHPGLPDEYTHFKITENLERELAESDHDGGPVNVFPCITGCVSGGGNHPTTSISEIKERIEWIRKLRRRNYEE